jgi:hypothetical protein
MHSDDMPAPPRPAPPVPVAGRRTYVTTAGGTGTAVDGEHAGRSSTATPWVCAGIALAIGAG